MKHRRRLLLFVVGLVFLAALGIGLIWLIAPRTRYTKSDYHAIKLGMTREELMALLGGPPWDKQGLGMSWWVLMDQATLTDSGSSPLVVTSLA
jgi:hypothetical protein